MLKIYNLLSYDVLLASIEFCDVLTNMLGQGKDSWIIWSCRFFLSQDVLFATFTELVKIDKISLRTEMKILVA